MLFVIFIIPREIFNMDMQSMQMDILLHVFIIFQNSNKLSWLRIQQIKFEFHTQPYINIAKFFCIFNMRDF